jgi:hypothetical protein
MTITAPAPPRYRTKPQAPHAYCVPIVRELPAAPVDIRDTSIW